VECGDLRYPAQMRSYLHDPRPINEYQLDDEFIAHIPSTYYDPHPPLPAYRNHEALISSDPRNPSDPSVVHSPELEDEPSMMLKNGIKLRKRQQDTTGHSVQKCNFNVFYLCFAFYCLGVAYTPDFDFDLWSEDFHRPHNLTKFDCVSFWVVFLCDVFCLLLLLFDD